MSCQLSRRELLKASTVAGAGALFLPRNILAQGESPNEKLDVALIGLGNQGGFQVGGMEQTRQNVVALCDVDDRMVNQRKAAEKFPGAKRFYDFRQMYDEMLEKIDAVCVSTPDHTHYHPAIFAIRAKKHVYLEKPMAHSVAECRIITEEADFEQENVHNAWLTSRCQPEKTPLPSESLILRLCWKSLWVLIPFPEAGCPLIPLSCVCLPYRVCQLTRYLSRSIMNTG